MREIQAGWEGGGSLTATLIVKYIMNKFMEISELCFVKVKCIWIAKRKIFQSLIQCRKPRVSSSLALLKQEVEAQMP